MEYVKKIYNRDSFDLFSFIKSAKRYLESKDEIPVVLVDFKHKCNLGLQKMHVYFFDSLLQRIVNNKNKFVKDLNSLLRYGYLGFSQRGKNGLIAVAERDKNLNGIVERFNSEKYLDYCENQEIFRGYKNLIPVKIVSHRKNGERIVGVLNYTTLEAILYDVKSYKK